MAGYITVQEGACVNSIAFQYGFAPDTIWNHPNNAALRTPDRSISILQPGDSVYVPDKTIKQISAPTDQVTVFKRNGVPAKLKLRFVDQEGNARASVSYRLDVDGKTIATGYTDPDGSIEQSIQPNANSGLVFLNETETYNLKLGSMDPSSQEMGVRKRLKNLGLLADETNDSQAANAKQAFLVQYLPDTSPSDGGTFPQSAVQKLVEVHGS
jgi:hypothetical protein